MLKNTRFLKTFVAIVLCLGFSASATGLMASAPNAANNSALTIWDNNLAYLGSNGHVIQLKVSNSTWNWGDISSSVTSGAPAADLKSPLLVMGGQIYYLSTAGHVCELLYDGSEWVVIDATVKAKAPIAASGGGMTNNDNSIFYVDTNGGLNQIYNNNSGWQCISQLGCGNKAAIGTAITFSNDVVYYQDKYNNVSQLNWTSVWNYKNLANASNAPDVAKSSGMISLNGGVFYVGTDGHVYQVWLMGNNYYSGVLPAPPSTVFASTGSALTTWNNDSVVYQGTDGQVSRFYWSDNVWKVDLLGGQAADIGSGMVTNDKSVFYVGTNGHVMQSTWNGNGWDNNDITNASSPF